MCGKDIYNQEELHRVFNYILFFKLGGGKGVGEEVLKQKGRSLEVRYPPGSAILNCIPLGKFCNLSGPAPQSNLEIVIPKAVRPSEYHLLAGQPW